MDLQAGGIDDQRDWIARLRLQLLSCNALSAPRQRREIGHRQVDFHQPHQRSNHALSLPKRLMEDQPQC